MAKSRTEARRARAVAQAPVTAAQKAAEKQAVADAAVRGQPAATDREPVRTQRKVTPAATRAAKKAVQDQAKAQALRDAKVRGTPLDVKVEPGKQLSLHELNTLARKADRESRDTIGVASAAAGQAVKQVLTGGKDTALASRYAKAATSRAVLEQSNAG